MRSSEYSEFLHTLKVKNDLVDVVGSYLRLERKGNNYWACCPFHHEKTPSFSINAADGFYHCFGCGVSGDVIGFIKEYENVDFPQAVQILAARAGLEVPVLDNRDAERVAEEKKHKDRCLEVMRASARFYLNNLYSGKADKFVEYIQKRKLEPTTVKKFGLGASLDLYSLPEHLRSLGYTEEEMLDSGVCSKSNGGSLIDFEAGRLIVPIINNLDEVVAFGGRAVEKTDFAKYKNTKETFLFNKRKNLYNVNLLKKEKKERAIDSVIMVEGYMDAISLYQAGFHNVVASMGTSLTKEQARLAKRYSDTVFISYDGDFAGQKANLRGLDILKSEGITVKVVPMPEGLDPDDVIKKMGHDGYQQCLDSAMPLIDFRILAARRKYDLTKVDERREYVKEALAVIRESETATEKEDLLRRLSKETDVSLSSLQRDLEDAPVKEETVVVPKQDSADRDKKASRFILCACLFSKPYAKDCDLEDILFEDETHRIVADFITEGRRQGYFRPSGIFDIVGEGDNEISEILNLDYGDNLDGETAERYFVDSIKTLKKKSLNERIKRLTAEYNETDDLEQRRTIVQKISQLTKKLRMV